MPKNNEKVQVLNDLEKNLNVDDNAKQRLQEFTTYIEKSPLDEQVKWAKIFDEKTKKYELESVVAGNSAEKNGEESVEVTNSDWENI
ncbi:hypothetical protein IKI14_03890 [bacterium]|nr:hypothetical protein [bacterium]